MDNFLKELKRVEVGLEDYDIGKIFLDTVRFCILEYGCYTLVDTKRFLGFCLNLDYDQKFVDVKKGWTDWSGFKLDIHPKTKSYSFVIPDPIVLD